MERLALPEDVGEFLERVVEQPDGYVLFLKGQLESIAAIFRTHPSVIEKARGWLHPAERRTVLNDRVVDLRRTLKLRRQREGPHVDEPVEHLPCRDAGELVTLLSTSRLGVEFLLDAPLETVAVLFLARPEVVEEARERVRDGMRQDGIDH